MRSATPVLLSVALVACDDCNDCDGSHVDPVPVFQEQEPNDDPLTANDFGVLHPGDRFFIDGFVRDDLADPFDGFAFIAATAVHVDFQLFIGNAAADLDVCLYDPQLDQTIACFATSNDPEQGGVDVTAGGLDFQLVIESFVGDATYSLEIVVQPLFAREALGEDEDGLRGTGAVEEHAPRARDGYRKPARAPQIVMEQFVEVDPESGLVIEFLHLRRDDL